MEPYNPATRTITSDRSPATASVDNLLRRALKISDPSNADEVAKGLLARYPEDAAKMKREQMGVPFSVMPMPVVSVVRSGTARPEVGNANDALERALTQLTTSPDLADIAPEMRGWATTIRRAAADGFSSGAFAIDANERDRAFGARRILGDYARLARYAAAINLCATEIYCRLAQACDLAANVILILIGNALADGGITRSGAVIQVSTATLQTRRDAVIVALRNLLQLTPTGDQETWPRGTLAVQQIYAGLDAAGSPDLRALLDEAYLSRQLDDLIDLATGSTPDGLRALGSTAAVAVQRLERFLIFADDLVFPDSPPATTFFADLQLFVQSFSGGNAGYRLPYLGRSPLLVSGSTTTGMLDQATTDLLTLALLRTGFADSMDCLCCTCDQDDTRDLIIAGHVLFVLDRALDQYALGIDPDGLGDAEWGAAAYGAVVLHALGDGAAVPPLVTNPMFNKYRRIAGLLKWPGIIGQVVVEDQTTRLQQFAMAINSLINEEKQWSNLVGSIAPLCRQSLLFRGLNRQQPAPNPLENPIGALLYAVANDIELQVGGWGGFDVPRDPYEVSIPGPLATSASLVAINNRYMRFRT